MLPKDDHEELFYQLALSFVNGVGGRIGRALLERFGSATDVFKAPLKQLVHIDGITETRAHGFKDADVMAKAENELNFILKNNIQLLYTGASYPSRLVNCNDAPLVLFYKGNVALNSAKMVAVVGTRKNTDYGVRLTEELVEGLRQFEDLVVVSGLALGIDAVAHKKSLALGIPTVGVLGHGLDRMYPPNHKGLAEQMVENGGILSEFVSGTIPDRTNFPMRNRIVAGLCDVTVVVESNIDGGALITARMASGYNRDVAAFPGRTTDARSAGCNELIRTNVAGMIRNADDLIEMMNWDKERKPKSVQRELFLNFSPEETKVVEVLQKKDAVHADELFHLTGLANSILAATLLQLEMQGLVKSLPGKYYRMQ